MCPKFVYMIILSNANSLYEPESTEINLRMLPKRMNEQINCISTLCISLFIIMVLQTNFVVLKILLIKVVSYASVMTKMPSESTPDPSSHKGT